MSGAVPYPFADLLARLTQAMSAPPPSPPVTHERGTQASACYTADERVVWLMGPPGTGIETVYRPFALTEDVTPDDQAWDHMVEIHGPSEARVGELHSLLVGWLDLLIGPEQGAAPSDDAEPAEQVGSVDLALLLYPTSFLDGLTLDFLSPYPMSVAMPAGPLASPLAVAVAIGAVLRAAGMPVLVALDRGDEDERWLRLSVPADPLALDAPVLQLNATTPTSACAALGLTGAAVAGAAPSMPYRPGYRVGKSNPGPLGGTVEAGAWGLTVPIRLFLPIRSMAYVKAMIQRVQLQVAAADASGEDIAVETPVPFPA